MRTERTNSLRNRGVAGAITVLCALAVLGATAHAQLIKQNLKEIEGVGIVERRGASIPEDIEFTDSFGQTVRMGSFFDGKRPVLLVMAYYDCPLLCTLVLNALQQTLNGMDWTAGNQFRVLTVSFDHTNTTHMAREKQVSYLMGYDREVEPDAWMFCTSDATNARRLAETVGFHYRYIPESGEFSHPAALIFLTPDGKVHNYLENLEYRPRDVKLALLEAAEGRVGSIFDRIQHLCFYYDPGTGHYRFAMNLMRTGGLVTMIALGGFITVVVVTAACRRRGEAAPEAPQPDGEA